MAEICEADAISGFCLYSVDYCEMFTNFDGINFWLLTSFDVS